MRTVADEHVAERNAAGVSILAEAYVKTTSEWL